jgi:hypothetical protein
MSITAYNRERFRNLLACADFNPCYRDLEHH